MDPKPQQTEEERKKNAPPQTNTREEKAPTETHGAGVTNEDYERLKQLRRKLEGLAPGRIVRAVLRGPYPAGQEAVTRPAIVVALIPEKIGFCNLQIFSDGNNDIALFGGADLRWGPGYTYSETHEPGTWHWPERD